MTSDDELTGHQRDLLFKLVETERSLPLEKQGQDFHVRPQLSAGQSISSTKEFFIDYQGVKIKAGEATVRALERASCIILIYRERTFTGGGTYHHYKGTLTAKAFNLYDVQRRGLKQAKARPLIPGLKHAKDQRSISSEEGFTMPVELRPHDEYILFKLVEFDSRELPKEEQSGRFRIEVDENVRPPKAIVFAATSSREWILKADSKTFDSLRSRNLISGEPSQLRSKLIEWSIELAKNAFDYYSKQHGFPSQLADERREFVNSVVSTEYPEVVSYLRQAFDDSVTPQPGDNWSVVAQRCDDGLETFAELLWKPDFADRLNEQEPPKDKYVKRLEQVIRCIADDDKLRGLLVKFQEYVAARRHDAGTTQSEAKRLVLYTYLIIDEIYQLLHPTVAN